MTYPNNIKDKGGAAGILIVGRAQRNTDVVLQLLEEQPADRGGDIKSEVVLVHIPEVQPATMSDEQYNSLKKMGALAKFYVEKLKESVQENEIWKSLFHANSFEPLDGDGRDIDLRKKLEKEGVIRWNTDLSKTEILQNQQGKNEGWNKPSKHKSYSIQREKDKMEEYQVKMDIDFDLIGLIDRGSPSIQNKYERLFNRNRRLVDMLKELYNGKCQISQKEGFPKDKGGKPYCEVHHLVPLGDGGYDSPENMIVVCPEIHRMLHFATVEGLDLSNITPDGELAIKINGQDYTITWKSEHRKLFDTE